MSDPKSALDSLYPFVGPVTSNPVSTSSLLESVHQKSRDSVRVQTEFFEQNADGVVEMAAGIAAVYRGGGRMFSMGNGGSSCDAAHFAVEFLHPVTAGRPALSVVNLSADSAMLSATGNDLGMEHVFSRSLSAHARSGDGVIGFSTSGESANLRRAFEQARSMQMRTFALVGGDGGAIAKSSAVEHVLRVPSDSIHRVQEVHVCIYHVLWDLVHTLLANQRGTTSGTPE